jgi:hypothetical protein
MDEDADGILSGNTDDEESRGFNRRKIKDRKPVHLGFLVYRLSEALLRPGCPEQKADEVTIHAIGCAWLFVIVNRTQRLAELKFVTDHIYVRQLLQRTKTKAYLVKNPVA